MKELWRWCILPRDVRTLEQKAAEMSVVPVFLLGWVWRSFFLWEGAYYLCVFGGVLEGFLMVGFSTSGVNLCLFGGFGGFLV